AGLMGSALTLLLDAQSLIPGIGASGAIAGVMGAFLLLYPSRRVRTLVFLLLVFVINIPAWILLGWWILQQAVLGQFVLNYGENLTGIGVWAHIGGFIGGIVLVWLFLRQEVMFNRESVMMTGRG
ncbi:MAG: rhomboid family intramembrane serine protease, partial [Nitrososphaera sp.]|nr:rhomboid family intramembrane serine protease [Nitrososphaera sp.]